jgi:hypothetical protein
MLINTIKFQILSINLHSGINFKWVVSWSVIFNAPRINSYNIYNIVIIVILSTSANRIYSVWISKVRYLGIFEQYQRRFGSHRFYYGVLKIFLMILMILWSLDINIYYEYLIVSRKKIFLSILFFDGWLSKKSITVIGKGTRKKLMYLDSTFYITALGLSFWIRWRSNSLKKKKFVETKEFSEIY